MSKLIIPRLIVMVALGFIGAFFIVAVFVKALEQVWIFLDNHPLWTGLSVLALFAVFGIVWLVRRLRG